ncbi:Protein of unknown function (DUF2911) [Bernardetia litoralis DSM 6794]|uniref:DUF2911 domain-containing protein n=1 Tax=Bernardetia litoralis (strain ATCC 23117 / DSM 6794 / NBRC 15988 / NCIMB 1366 / Fx l1 / Sio-4) TaxID=880071 RepID=I4AMA2_BERLS|nr:DUF2911 domain-containing protein [Bernardetia litoralis]AFM05087.1 Protein of unknown function (DUF2911) [Bernardetia litoralis DSM 6794]
MLKFSTFSFVFTLIFMSFSAFAQLEMPQPSPSAMIKQTVGLTDITIDYSSPAMRDREIFGKLVPYGELWRTGANKATAITFSDDVTIEGKKIEAGSYAFFTIPNENEWTIILNKNTEQWGAGEYDEKEDVIRLTAKPSKAPMTFQRMTFMILALENHTAEISLLWADTKVSFMVDANPVAQVVSEIESSLKQADNLWYTYAQSAEYYLDNNQNKEQAQEWIDKSIVMNDHFYNNWVKARILVARNNTGGVSSSAAAAVAIVKKAMAMGEKENTNFYKRLKPKMEQFIKTYSQQLPAKGKKDKKN